MIGTIPSLYDYFRRAYREHGTDQACYMSLHELCAITHPRHADTGLSMFRQNHHEQTTSSSFMRSNSMNSNDGDDNHHHDDLYGMFVFLLLFSFSSFHHSFLFTILKY